MALSIIDLYKKLLPKTNCRECGFPTCLAFAGMVVSEGIPLDKCPHIDAERLAAATIELSEQRRSGKWTKKDLSEDALKWAKERSASMKLEELPKRIGGSLVEVDGDKVLEIPYFSDTLLISKEGLYLASGRSLSRWEQVFIYNHMAQGGSREPTGRWKGFIELPNTVSKIKTMERSIQEPIAERFHGRSHELKDAALMMGGKALEETGSDASAVIIFRPLPRLPVMLMFWDGQEEEGYGSQARFLFDETITEHLDIESILFLSERIKQLLCGEGS
jgi:hypothetical protein